MSSVEGSDAFVRPHRKARHYNRSQADGKGVKDKDKDRYYRDRDLVSDSI